MPKLRDTHQTYGAVSRWLHWLMAIAIFAMFALGVWMRTLTYYHPYYHSAPQLHKSIGIVLLGLLFIRFLWRLVNTDPDDDHLTKFERLASSVVHWGFYPLLLALFISGYLISTADGRPIEPFGLFSVPATLQLEHQEDIAGAIHRWLAYGIIALALLHTAAALKHHFIDRDTTLRRMWSGN